MGSSGPDSSSGDEAVPKIDLGTCQEMAIPFMPGAGRQIALEGLEASRRVELRFEKLEMAARASGLR
jgi:hypothetical protein